MKSKILLIFLLSLPSVLLGKIQREISLSYCKDDFSITCEAERGLAITPLTLAASYSSDTLSLALPYILVNILIGEDESFDTFTFSFNEEVWLTNILVAHQSPQYPTNSIRTNKNNHITYEKDNYPDKVIEYTGTHLVNGYKYLSFQVCPFRYDAVTKSLFLKAEVKILLHLSNDYKKMELPKGFNRKHLDDAFFNIMINKNDLETLYGDTGLREKSLLEETVPYKYLIITADSLKSSFEKLSRWKTIKGVRSKVLTLSEIANEYIGGTIPLKIKNALSDYYAQGLQYALIGGDHDVVPSLMCYLPHESITPDTYDTPVDLFYACFDSCFNWDQNGNGICGELDDNIDLAPEIAISRASVRNVEEADIFVKRIIEYESNPNTIGWEDNILMCGSFLSYNEIINGDTISDAQLKSEYMYETSILPYWQGNRFRLYDSYTDYPDGANYQFTAAHLQTEMEKGYTIIDEATHAWSQWWGWLEEYPLYYREDARALENKRYSIISTISCYSNSFDTMDECLSESFMRNPNSGILAYIGSSREGWTTSSFNMSGKFYESLFNSTDKRIVKAVNMAKISFLGSSNNWSSKYRWLILSINPLGDPEMPLFTSIPQRFENVQLSFDNGILTIDTGVDSCMLCISSTNEETNFYSIMDNVSHIVLNNLPEEYYVCVTKPGYIPFVCTAGENIYIQNETLSDYNLFISKEIQIGSNVTSIKSKGPVTIISGRTDIKAKNDVILKNNCEVKKGAELIINCGL